MEQLDIISILKLGLPGLVFLLMLMSFKLITNEQQKDKPNLTILKVIRTFVYVNVFLAILTIAAPILERYYPENAQVSGALSSMEIKAVKIASIEGGEASVCTKSEFKNNYMLLRNPQSMDIIQVRAKPALPCQENENTMGISASDAKNLGWQDNEKEANLIVDVAAEGYKFDF